MNIEKIRNKFGDCFATKHDAKIQKEPEGNNLFSNQKARRQLQKQKYLCDVLLCKMIYDTVS